MVSPGTPIITEMLLKVALNNINQWDTGEHLFRRDRDRMVIEFTTICAISAYHH